MITKIHTHQENRQSAAHSDNNISSVIFPKNNVKKISKIRRCLMFLKKEMLKQKSFQNDNNNKLLKYVIKDRNAFRMGVG